MTRVAEWLRAKELNLVNPIPVLPFAIYVTLSNFLSFYVLQFPYL